MAYSWPGNVRELENVIERTVALCDKDLIDAEDLPPNLQEGSQNGGALQVGSEVSLDDLERRHIESILRKTGNHQIRAAGILGIDRRTLYRKLIKYGLKPGARERGDKEK
jgi:two-component system response regulator HydG